MRNISYSHWIGLAASIIGIATPFIPVVKESKYEILFALLIALIAISFVLRENIYLKTHWRRKKRYPEIFKILNGGFAPLNQLPRINLTDKKQIISIFSQSCNKIAEAFTWITDSPCSVAIKVIKGDFRVQGYDISIDTFVRDDNSMYNRNNIPYQSPMTIEENTDFKEICLNLKNGHKDVRHYFSNDLVADVLKGYKNSRLGQHFYDFIKSNKSGGGYSSIAKFWPLKYRSTIVVAIYPLAPEKEYELIGFLCIDSPKSNVFFEYDQEILYGIADTMFNYIDYIKGCYDDFHVGQASYIIREREIENT